MKRVFVTNLPVCVRVDAWVEVPESTPPEQLNEAVRCSVLDGGLPDEFETPKRGDIELDEMALLEESGWDFCMPLEKP